MPHVLPLPSSTGVKSDEGIAKEPEVPIDGSGNRRRSLLQGIQRLGHRKRRDEDGKFSEAHEEDIADDTQGPNGTNGPPARRRSLLRRIPQKWRGKSESSRAPGHRRLKSEERPITPSLVPQYELELNARKRAMSETRRVVVQNSRGSSTTRQSSTTRPTLNGRSSNRELRDVQQQFKRFKLDDTAEAAEPDDEGRSQPPNQDQPDMTPDRIIAGRPSSRGSEAETIDREIISEELDTKWILNLSMQFRDETRQEKLFITYAEKPNFWRRVTVTWDYRHLRRNSMEEDLKTLTLQRDKNMRVYESLRVSLPDINFFDTVTNLKLKTEGDDRLHIYVCEDVDEIIEYPPISQASHVRCPQYKESEVIIDAHLSGFVYRVRANGKECVKKEIPGPNNIEEFIYELDALDMLRNEPSVIDLQGIVTDDKGEVIKGLLISFASRGSLVELIYDFRGSLPWARRKKWARQIIQGLAAIHESGFVQGDFTLSNVVVDDQDDAHIIDLNRRGCPIGWEPPELMRLILSKQKIAMMISTKTDLYQLGMVLYALAEQVDEPDRHDQDELYNLRRKGIPRWYTAIMRSCLETDPRDRKSATALLAMFDEGAATDPPEPEDELSHGSELADPANNVTHEDIAQHLSSQHAHTEDPGSCYYRTQSGRSEIRPFNNRGRSSIRHPPPSTHTSLSDEFVTPGPYEITVPIVQQIEAESVASPKSASMPSRSHQALSLPPMSEEQRSSSKVSDSRSATQGAQPNPFGFQHQDSGLADMGRDSWQRVASISHQDSGFADYEMVGMDDHDRFMMPERRDTARDEPSMTPAAQAARAAAQRAAGGRPR
ncbi:Hypothetical protein D9617_1g082920 [Elsinoe fawcettii]|nr:Hypothetical protein D9617_1g082920 [Elsinoe fawcettii]